MNVNKTIMDMPTISYVGSDNSITSSHHPKQRIPRLARTNYPFQNGLGFTSFSHNSDHSDSNWQSVSITFYCDVDYNQIILIFGGITRLSKAESQPSLDEF